MQGAFIIMKQALPYAAMPASLLAGANALILECASPVKVHASSFLPHAAPSSMVEQCTDCKPPVQIKLLKILAYLGAGDKTSSDNMYAVLGDTLRKANTGHTISNAIVAECVQTITAIYPNPGLLQAGGCTCSLATASLLLDAIHSV